MFDFTQYLGFLLFLTVLTIGFWLMFFLVGFVSYWVGGATWEAYVLFHKKRTRFASPFFYSIQYVLVTTTNFFVKIDTLAS